MTLLLTSRHHPLFIYSTALRRLIIIDGSFCSVCLAQSVPSNKQTANDLHFDAKDNFPYVNSLAVMSADFI